MPESEPTPAAGSVGEPSVPPLASVTEQLKVVRKRWPDPTAAELAAVLRAFPEAGRLQRIRGYGDRPTSSAAIVETTREPLFVKRLNVRGRTPATARIEHAFVDHLREHGLTVPRYLRTADGDTVLDEGDWVYEVTTLAIGEDRYRGVHTWSPPAVVDAFGAGAALASLHHAAEGFDAPARDQVAQFALFTPTIRQLGEADLGFGTRWERWLAERPATAGYLAAREVNPASDFASHLRFHARAAPLVATLPPSWTHGDWHVSNLFWHDHVVSETIDFGLANRIFALYDLATAIDRNAIGWLEILAGDDTATRPDVADRMLSGYESVRPLTDTERRALPELLPIVQTEFALSALEEQIVADRVDLADWSFDVFFLAHTRWFDTPAGDALLDSLRDRQWDTPTDRPG